MFPEILIDDDLGVRPITMEDTADIVRWRANPRVKENFLYRGPFDEAIHTHWMNTKVASGEVIQFIILLNERPVGSVYFRDVDPFLETAEYGIFIGEDSAIGLKIGNKVAKWAVDYARRKLNLKSLMLRVLADNEPAIRSYENAGFVKESITPDFIDGRDLMFMKIDF